MDTGLWTMAELADRVADALSSGYGGQQSRRVANVPDTRAIRYYTTLGLLDRPAEMRGRTAFYGPRHLWQLVAIKRLQADGRTLAEIQQELAAASDGSLKRLAGLPDEGFWRHVPKPAARPTAPALDRRPVQQTYQAVPLDSGAIVLIPRSTTLTEQDIATLQAVAGPLDAAIAQLSKGQS
jgi:DNA-binding transcriptional MerR regulator